MEANCVEMARFHLSSVSIKAFIPFQCSKLKDNLLQCVQLLILKFNIGFIYKNVKVL